MCQLSLFMQPEKIFRQLATILENEEEPEFAATVVSFVSALSLSLSLTLLPLLLLLPSVYLFSYAVL